jgi:SET domain-containing protein
MSTTSYHHPSTAIRSSGGKGQGLFATATIAAGELVVITGGRIIATRDIKSERKPEHPFQIEKDFLLAPWDADALEGIFTVNHSCNPTTGIRSQGTLVALREIQAGEEICYDYVMTDSDPAGAETFRMTCLCRTARCRDTVTDLDWREPELRARYRGFFSPYLAERISRL